ncbi:uracil-xanthine permease [Anaerotruncus colihominis]|uniref:Uracil-xanthine permease n=1 Tax=Anaerotruncus colihominis TaxID=169435 RepID=A0A845RKA7_9FIRM|nr:uracil-xanthine permease family protein [Anaerotruncus colihominis]NBI79348.1 uracil-xanthine permease [Anaerotruncus colihominis]
MANKNTGIYNAPKELGWPKTVVLGFQHVFAMFGATVVVPIITGLNVQTTLFCAGIGTLFFHLVTQRKAPVFLGSSFAFLGGFAAVKALPLTDAAGNALTEAEKLPYACGGIVIAGLVYAVLAALIRTCGIKRIMHFFPPVVTGPIIILIGLILAPNAVNDASSNWLLAVVAIVIVVAANIFGKGMIKIIPILLGIIGSYIVAVVTGCVDFSAVGPAPMIGMVPITLAKFDVSAIIIMVPIALATMMEHVGDIAAIGATCNRNFLANPGLHRTLIGDGVATSIAGMLGGPANTTYSENTGVLALTKVYDPVIMEIAAVVAICFGFVPKFGEFIHTIPTATIGGVSFILYGMISAIGVRNVVENQVDFTESRNVLIAAIIMISGLGFNSIGGITFHVGSASITLSGLAVAALLGILLNAIFPGNDYEFSEEEFTQNAVRDEVKEVIG